jgi:hypothetical protein
LGAGPKLEDLFEMRNGLSSSVVNVSPHPGSGMVPYIRPASTQKRTIAGWVAKGPYVENHLYPAETIFVSTDGEGSHTYSYVSDFEFIPNSNVSVLLPRRSMSLNEKVYYACCITMNRYKFSYGRKPKGDRLKQIDLPDSIPDWVSDTKVPELITELMRMKDLSKTARTPIQPRGKDKSVRIQKIFEIRYGHSLELNRLKIIPRESGGIPFISRKMGDNGIAAFVEPVDGMTPTPAGQLSCALSGNGVLSTFYQEQPFYTAYHVACLRPLAEMSIDELLYYCACIRQNRFRFSYGRQANRTLKDLLVPAREAVPDWINGALARVTDELISIAAN